jgi:hypothetical protein
VTGENAAGKRSLEKGQKELYTDLDITSENVKRSEKAAKSVQGRSFWKAAADAVVDLVSEVSNRYTRGRIPGYAAGGDSHGILEGVSNPGKYRHRGGYDEVESLVKDKYAKGAETLSEEKLKELLETGEAPYGATVHRKKAGVKEGIYVNEKLFGKAVEYVWNWFKGEFPETSEYLAQLYSIVHTALTGNHERGHKKGLVDEQQTEKYAVRNTYAEAEEGDKLLSHAIKQYERHFGPIGTSLEDYSRFN